MNMLKISLKGLPGAIGILQYAKKKVFDETNSEVHKIGFFLESEVKDSIAGNRDEMRSVDTGRFLNSVSTDNSQVLRSTVFSNVPYAGYLEDGTDRIRPPRKHFEMSLARNKRKIRDKLQFALK